jgi:hypothetical protein
MGGNAATGASTLKRTLTHYAGFFVIALISFFWVVKVALAVLLFFGGFTGPGAILVPVFMLEGALL